MAKPSGEATQRRDQINAQLQLRFLEPQMRNLLFGAVLVTAVAAFLWPHANHRGLIVWVGLVVLTLVPPALVKRVNPSFRVFYRMLIGLELLSGLAWGSGSLIAMPRTLIWQSIMLMLFIGVLMSGASNLGHFFGVFLSFHLPLAVSVCAGFLLQTDWPDGPFLAIWILGFVYVGASAFEARQTQGELVRANLELEEANHLLDAQARTDKLTGLANRLDFSERLEGRIAALVTELPAAARRRPVTLGYLDIDRFKQINDEFGHHVGDGVLQQGAERLMAAATETELVARLGGDELTVLSSVDAESLGRRVLACFDEPFEIDGRIIAVKVSVGVASARRNMSGEELMRNADAALYAAKGAGGARHVVYGSSVRLHTEQRLTLESELHAALITGEIVPWVQPIVDLSTGEILAAEALARWEHRDGVRSAASFIGMIRQVGLMREYTAQLVTAVEGFHASMRSSGIQPVPISINVPCSHLEQIVELENLQQLIVEVTEETAIDDEDETRELLTALRRAGHQVWLDDFGTGFSSLKVAAKLPLDGLKVDREFVSELLISAPVRSVVTAIAALAEQLSVDVVAEGVENHAQAEMLRHLGVAKAQGHLWSPAVPFADFAQWLSAGHRFAVRDDEARENLAYP